MMRNSKVFRRAERAKFTPYVWRFLGGDSLPLCSKASLEYAVPGKSLAAEGGLRLHEVEGGTEVTPSWRLEMIRS